MAIAQEPTKWTMPLGVNADANSIPDTAPEYTGAASMDSVFPQITQLPLEAGGIAPTRADFNGLFKLLGASIYYLQRGGIFSYADNVDYPAGAVVKFGNGIYIAIQENGPTGTVVDPTDPDYWRHLTTTVNNQYADSSGNVDLSELLSNKADKDLSNLSENGKKVIADGNLTKSGWTRLANGLILQWGSHHHGDVSDILPHPISFNIPFPNKCLQVIVSTSETGAGNGLALRVGEPTKTGFNYAMNEWTAVAQDATVLWFAVGY